MPDKPRFRRGIKLGRVRKVKEPIVLHRIDKATKKRTDEIIGIRFKTVGYEDRKTGKRLNASEISAFKSYKAAIFNERLRKRLPENAPERQRKTDRGVIVDRFTGKPASRNQIIKATNKRLQPKRGGISPLLPKKYYKAARTIERERGKDFDETLKTISDWWVQYSTQQITQPFPRQELYA